MSSPLIAIVGRPNVGKSSLLNCLSLHRTAIVTPVSGTTRDPVRADVEHEGRLFTMIDTGGMGMDDAEVLAADVAERIEKTIATADLVLFVVDIREGLVPMDREIGRTLRKHEQKVILVANKADTTKLEMNSTDFFEIGFGQPLPVSARENLGRHILLDAVSAALPEFDETGEATKPILMVAIVGKRNTGKSTFANALLKEDRMIVSDIPGTTRDSVDLLFEKDGQSFMAIDTAGLRRKVRIDSEIEYYSAHRTERAIRRADVTLFFLDASVDISQVDMKICRYIVDQNKPCVIVVNKWDLAEGIATETYVRYLEKRLRGVSFAPIVFASAKEGKQVLPTIDLARSLHKQACLRVSTAQINAALDRFRTRPLRADHGKKIPRIYFGTQVSTDPPLIVLSVNAPVAFSQKARRTIVTHLRHVLPFPEVPIRLRLRSHHP